MQNERSLSTCLSRSSRSVGGSSVPCDKRSADRLPGNAEAGEAPAGTRRKTRSLPRRRPGDFFLDGFSSTSHFLIIVTQSDELAHRKSLILAADVVLGMLVS
ncbi:unnamed protein product [Caenorhabditis auriculariae]|uniref:Uncharacterized protein n=1 Tax=Caenorhabditis auriculariae TaxID=2777116 RepID=A0A8S1GVP7_9PELO|nr:unnamed protein product [Caenorhabditis auriculariae]